MRFVTEMAASAVLMLNTAEAGFLFTDIRPKSYREETPLEI